MHYHARIELKSQKTKDETKVDMTLEELEERILRPYEMGEPIIINGKTILPSDVDRIRVTKSEVPSSTTIEHIKREDAASPVAMMGGPSYQWRAASRGDDVTDDFIKGPPGHKAATKRIAGKQSVAAAQPKSTKRVFVVHGHDHALKSDLEVFLHGIGLEPIVLHRQPDQGLTVIEKFEQHSDVQFAFVLLTPDDIASTASQADAEPDERSTEFRARQNVIFEFGFFVGKLGRPKVCCIYKEGATLPSDLSGLLYKQVSTSIEDIGYNLIKELQNAGLEPEI